MKGALEFASGEGMLYVGVDAGIVGEILVFSVGVGSGRIGCGAGCWIGRIVGVEFEVER